MSSEKEGLLFDGEERDASEDVILDQRCRHHEARCLLEDESRSSGHCPRYITFFSLFYIYFLFLHIICLLLGASLFWTTTRVPSSQDLAILDFDNRYPDWVPVSYELRREDPLETPENEFTGMPNENNTKAWDDLIMPTFFSASQDDLQKTGESVNDSVRLADGGYIVGLSVYHNIHCLRRLRLFLHSDYYYGNLTETNMDYLRGHLGHCIESLRRSIMCTADTNIYTFTWTGAEYVRPDVWRPAPKSNQDRKCVRWEALEDWVMKRHVALNPILLKPSGEEEEILMI